MSRVKYPNKREIEAQVKQIIVRSDIFSGANQEYEAEDFEPVRRKTSYYKLAIKTGVAVAFAAVMFMLLKPVFDSANLNSSQALNNGADYDDNLGVETETDNQDWKTGDEADTDAETVGSNENESATFGSSYDEINQTEIMDEERFNITVRLATKKIRIEEDGQSAAINISFQIPRITNKYNFGTYINRFYENKVVEIYENISQDYTISSEQQNKLISESYKILNELISVDTIQGLIFESDKETDNYGNSESIYSDEIRTKNSIVLRYYSNYIKPNAISDNVASFCDTCIEYTIDGNTANRIYGNNFKVSYNRPLEYSDILKDYESGMQTIAEYVYQERLKINKYIGNDNVINKDKYESLEKILETLKEENNWYFSDKGIVICLNDYEKYSRATNNKWVTEYDAVTICVPFDEFDIIKDEYKSEKYPELINTQKMYLPEGITK